jgi:hypothetical protein
MEYERQMELAQDHVQLRDFLFAVLNQINIPLITPDVMIEWAAFLLLIRELQVANLGFGRQANLTEIIRCSPLSL